MNSRRVLTPDDSPKVEVAASNSSGGAAAGAAPAPLRAPPVPEVADATPVDTAGEPADDTPDVNAVWVELVERIRLEKTGIIKLTKH